MIKKETYKVRGMTCAACQAHVEKALNSVNGVKKAGADTIVAGSSVFGAPEVSVAMQTLRDAQ